MLFMAVVRAPSPSVLHQLTVQHGLHHSIANLYSALKARLKELLRDSKALAPRLKLAQRYTLGPAAGGDGELQIISPKGIVLDADAQTVVQQARGAEQVLGDTQPQAKQRGRADHMVVRDDAQHTPAVDHSEQAEMIVGQGRAVVGTTTKAELVEHTAAQQRTGRPLGAVLGTEHLLLGGVDAGTQLLAASLEHQVVELRGRPGELVDLLVGFGVEDGEPCVDVPLLRVDAQHQVDFDVFDAAYVACPLPRELCIGVPCLAHAQERRVRDGLRVGRDTVVLLSRQVDMLGVETAEDRLNFVEGLIRGTVVDQHQWLPLGVNTGAMERVTGDDVHIARQILLEGLDLRVFA